MDKRSRPRRKFETRAAVMEAVRQAQLFGAEKASSGFVSRYARITPQHANRILRVLWQEGEIAVRWVKHREGVWKQTWVTAGYAKKHPEYVLFSDVPVQQRMEI